MQLPSAVDGILLHAARFLRCAKGHLAPSSRTRGFRLPAGLSVECPLMEAATLVLCFRRGST